MKKLFAVVMVVILLLTCCVSAWAEIEVKEFPEKPADFSKAVNPADPLNTIFSGAFSVKIAVDETTEKAAVVYLAEDFQQTQGFVMIVPDSGMTAVQALEEGGWKDVADANGLYLMVLEPDGVPVDQAYLEAATKKADERDYWRQPEGRNYMAAYGDSASPALQFVESYLPNVWAGIATFGDVKLTASDIVNEKGIELPVWMFMTVLDDEAEIIELLKDNNDCTDEAFQNAYADAIYFPNQLVNDLLLNDQPMSQVRVTVAEDAAELKAERAQYVYDFLKLGTREVGYGDKAMRYTRNLEDWGATEEYVEIDGITRSWVQYVPTRLRETAEGKVPLLVAIHGSALNAEYFADRTNYIRLAEEYGAIIVFPSGSINTGVAPQWNRNRVPEQWDDVKFIDTMIDVVSEKLPVDTSRIYVYGHSLGGMTTQSLISYLDGRFAAAAGTGCVNASIAKVDHQYQTPIFVIMGEFDMFGTTFDNEASQYFIDYFTEYNGVEKDKYIAYRAGRFENYIWQNEAGAPMVRFSISGDMPHTATMNEGIEIFEFLFQFSRGEDGSVIYGGGIYDAK